MADPDGINVEIIYAFSDLPDRGDAQGVHLPRADGKHARRIPLRAGLRVKLSLSYCPATPGGRSRLPSPFPPRASKLRLAQNHRRLDEFIVRNGNAPIHPPFHRPFCSKMAERGRFRGRREHLLHDRVQCLRSGAPCEPGNRSHAASSGTGLTRPRLPNFVVPHDKIPRSLHPAGDRTSRNMGPCAPKPSFQGADISRG